MMFIRVPVHTYVSYHYLQKPRFKYAGTHVRVLGYVLSGLRYFMQFRVCRACMGVGVVGCGADVFGIQCLFSQALLCICCCCLPNFKGSAVRFCKVCWLLAGFQKTCRGLVSRTQSRPLFPFLGFRFSYTPPPPASRC